MVLLAPIFFCTVYLHSVGLKSPLAKTDDCNKGLFTPKTHVFFCCGDSAAAISKSHTFKWDQLADEVLEAA